MENMNSKNTNTGDNEPTEWDNLAEGNQAHTTEGLPDAILEDNSLTNSERAQHEEWAVAEHNKQLEQEATHEDYGQFARERFNYLLDALDNPKVNATPEDEQAINSEIAIIADLALTLTDSEVTDQPLTKGILGALVDKYSSEALNAAEQQHPREAERNHRFAEAATRLNSQFVFFIQEKTAKATNATQDSAANDTASDTLPDDVIS